MEHSLRQEVSDMSVGLLMTYRCNLDCKYCYIHSKKNKDMTLEMAQSILEPFLLMKGGLLDIKFMGGETLLAIDVIIPLVEWIHKRKWRRSYRLFGSTNGTLLTKDIKEWLQVHKQILTLGLSYDGVPIAQRDNRTDREIDIDFFAKTWPDQPIQMTINQESVKYMAAGVIYLLKKNVPVHPNVAFEMYEWSEECVREYKKQLVALLDFYKYNPQFPLITQFMHDLDEYAENIENPPSEIQICGAGNGAQIFDIDGKSYNCHILSPLVLDKLQLDNLKTISIDSYKDITQTRCYGCPYVTSCPTCIACNYAYRESMLKRDSTHCEVMKAEVEIFIKHEIQRLKDKRNLSSDDATLIDSICRIIQFEKSKKVR